MARPCTTCQHLHRAAIDRRLAAGEPVKRVARDYGLSPVSLGRHKANCAGIAPGPEITKAASRGTAALASLPSREALGEAYDAIRRRADQIVRQAEGAGSLAIALTGLREMRSTLDSLSRLAGHDRPAASSLTVDLSININAAVQVVLAAIGPEPSDDQILALEALVDAEDADAA